MTRNTVRSITPLHSLASTGDVRVGRIVDVREGRPVVEFGGARMLARVALTGQAVTTEAMLQGQPVLLVLENSDPGLPIIVGLVSDTLPAPANTVAPGGPQDRFEIDGKRIAFEGREEVVLRCGEASITLRADGQVVMKGTRVTSRASETNKIRGATVQIN